MLDRKSPGGDPAPPEIPAPLPRGAARVDRDPAEPNKLPDWAKDGWKQPAGPAPRPPASARNRVPDPAPPERDLPRTILETHAGVEALQELLESPEGESRLAVLVELLESVAHNQGRIAERQTAIEECLNRIAGLLQQQRAATRSAPT